MKGEKASTMISAKELKKAEKEKKKRGKHTTENSRTGK